MKNTKVQRGHPYLHRVFFLIFRQVKGAGISFILGLRIMMKSQKKIMANLIVSGEKNHQFV